MNNVPGVFGGDLHRRVPCGSGCAADQERQFQSLVLELLGHLHHLVEAGRDQAAEPHDVDLLGLRLRDDLRAGHHHAQVDHLVAVAAQHHAHDVLADVMHVALDGGHQHAAAFYRRRALRLPLLLHVGQEMVDRPFHHASALHHLRQEHLSFAEQVAHRLHATHQRAFDDLQAGGIVLPGILDVLLHMVGHALHQGMREPFLDVEAPPGVGLRRVGRIPLLDRLGIFDEPVGGVGAAIEEHVLDPLQKVLVDILIDRQLARVDDPHVHAGLDGVVEERRVHRLADRLVAAEGEGDVADPPRHLHQRHRLLDPPRCLDEVQRIAVMFLDAGGHREDVGIEDDVFGRETGLFREQVVGPLADRHATFDVGGLPLLVEGHDDDGGAVAADRPRVPQERLLPLLEADGVDDALALDALEPGFQDLESRTVNHHGHAGDVGLAGEEREELRHHGGAVEHSLIDVDVDDVGAVLDLLPGNADGLLVAFLLDQAGEGPRAGDVRPLADHRETALRTEFEHFEAGITAPSRGHGGLPRRILRDRLGDGLDVGRRRAAAAADDVEPPLLREFAQHAGHRLGRLIEAAQRVGKAGIRIAADQPGGDPRQVGQVRPQLFRAQRAVDAHGQEVDMAQARPAGLDRLRGEGAATLEHGERGHHRQPDARVAEYLLDGIETAFQHERVEGGFCQEQINASLDQCLDLLAVGGHHLVERDIPVAGIGDVAGDRELLVGGPDRAGHEPRPIWCLRRCGVGRFPGEAGRSEVHLAGAVGQTEVGQGEARGPEGVGLDDVSARLEVGRMDAPNRVSLREHEHVDAVLQILGVIAERRPSKPLLVKLQGMHHGAHRPVENGDAVGQESVERIDTGGQIGRGHQVSCDVCGDGMGVGRGPQDCHRISEDRQTLPNRMILCPSRIGDWVKEAHCAGTDGRQPRRPCRSGGCVRRRGPAFKGPASWRRCSGWGSGEGEGERRSWRF